MAIRDQLERLAQDLRGKHAAVRKAPLTDQSDREAKIWAYAVIRVEAILESFGEAEQRKAG